MATIISKGHKGCDYWFAFESVALDPKDPVIFYIDVTKEIWDKYEEHDVINL